MAKEFTPKQYYKVDKKGNFVLDDEGCKIPLDLYRGTKFADMVEFLKENGTDEEKAEFKKACHTKKVYEKVIGKKGGEKRVPTGETTTCDEINGLYAKEWFFGKFAPEYLPVAEDKPANKSMADLLDEL